MTASSLPYPNVLVIAATGKTGRRVAPLLEAKGVNIRRGSRSSSPAFDWALRDTWAPALSSMDAAYVVYLPDPALPGAAEDIRAFAEVAKQQGVGKLVLLSGRGVMRSETAEQAITGSGLDWTLVRAAWFNQNFTEGDFADQVRGGTITLPMADFVEPIIDADDIAEVVAETLTSTKYNGETLNLTGPVSITHAQIAAYLSRASGRQIDYAPISMDEFRAALTEAQLPSEYIGLLLHLFEITRSGVNAEPTNEVERVLGRPATSFEAFASRAASNGELGVR
ncbi:MAG: NAD(P)H-binding protein [Planctomycetota bacterium]